MAEPESIFDRLEPRAIGLLATMALGGLLLIVVAVALLGGGGDASTAAGDGSAAPVGLASGAPESPDGATPGQFPSSTEPASPTSLPVESSATVSSTTVPTTAAPTTAAPTTAAPTTAAPATTMPPTAPSTTAAPSTEPPTTLATEPSTTMAPSSTAPSTETTATPTTVAPTTAAPTSTTIVPPTSTPPTTAGPSGDDAAIQQQVLDATNAARSANGCGPLRLDPLLNRAADGHSEDMSARDYFSHSDPEGRGPGVRIDAVGYPHRGWGENIAAGHGSAQAVVDGWMNSAGHRANILNCGFDEIGIGYAESGRYWTQLFATRG